MHINIYPDTQTLSSEAAPFIVRLANEALVSHGRFTIALSGGSTPKVLYGLLGDEPYRSQIDWTRVEIFWSDERCVPPDDKESNYAMAQQVLLSKIPIPANQIHRMPVDQTDQDAASQAYTVEMQRAFSTDQIPNFDLIQLGMGPEGHTASLFPHQASLHEQQRLVMPVSVPKPPPPRLTFTPPLLNAAKHILFLVTGSEKADAQVVRPTNGEVIWMLDRAAAGKLAKQS
ncbi:MAG: 6-phosphogluconolactonase [Ktedonobacteraceae bacterium]